MYAIENADAAALRGSAIMVRNCPQLPKSRWCINYQGCPASKLMFVLSRLRAIHPFFLPELRIPTDTLAHKAVSFYRPTHDTRNHVFKHPKLRQGSPRELLVLLHRSSRLQ